MSSPLLTFTDKGIYCPQADVFIDPWQPVDKALLTHAHSDHARFGSKQYLAHNESREVLKIRLGHDIHLETIEYGQRQKINGVEISFHPAGHVIGSAQIRLAYKDQTWVVSGDYKVENDGFTTPFEPVECSHFVTESTFGLPVFDWRPQHEIMVDINNWWKSNRADGKVSIVSAYALGKAQRIIDAIDHNIGRTFVHGAIHNVNEALMRNGIQLKPTSLVSTDLPKEDYQGALVIAPGSAIGTSWTKRFRPFAVAQVSGWMNIRGIKKRRGSNQGFVLSDHADWKGLIEAVKLTKAENIYVTHGYKAVFSRWLSEQGWNAHEVETLYEAERSSGNSAN